MALDPVRDARGAPRYRCICDDCGREDTVAARHGRDGSDGHGQAVSKIQRLGWSYIGKRLRCGTCEAKRKVEKMAAKTEQKTPAETAPREPTRVQKREIMDILSEVYDHDRQCYCGGETDDTVAKVLNVMPGWVAGIRDEFFGPGGSNDDMAALGDEIRKFMQDTQARLTAAKLEVESLEAVIGRVSSMSKTLDQIKDAVGPRNLVRVK